MYLYRQIVVLILLIKSLAKQKYSPFDSVAFFLFWPSSFFEFIQYFGRAYVLQDVTLYIALRKRFNNVHLIRKSTLSKLTSDSRVFYSAVPFKRGIYNQGEYMFKILSEFDCIFFPSPKEIRFWENKDFMHQEFDRLEIPTPVTHLISHSQMIPNKIKFPVLTKILNGNHSRGIVSHNSQSELNSFLKFTLRDGVPVLLQEQLDIEFDLRVVTVNFKIVYFYWRDKIRSDKFNTTSTSNGSCLRLDPLPSDIILCIEDSSKKLGLRLAAFDITYKKIDFENHPVIFEVSPSFLLNPIPDNELFNGPYLNYKKSWWKFTNDRISQFIVLKEKYVNAV